jgi:hypothetical protein
MDRVILVGRDGIAGFMSLDALAISPTSARWPRCDHLHHGDLPALRAPEMKTPFKCARR